MAKRELVGRIRGDAKPLLRANRDAARSLRTLGREGKKLDTSLSGSFKSAFTNATKLKLGIAGLATAGLAGIGKLNSLAREQVQLEKQLAQVIKSTGNAANMTMEEHLALADALGRVTNGGDEAVIRAQNLLLTFTKIGRDVFPEAIETALNMSAALGTDVKGSAIQLGKALNDPIKGVTALADVGVSFTKAQREVIKSLAETGRVAEAQKLILEELAVEFGGQAKALADPWTLLQNAVKDAGQEFGRVTLAVTGAIARQAEPAVRSLIAQLAELPKLASESLASIAKPAAGLTAGLKFALRGITFLFDQAKALVALGLSEITGLIAEAFKPIGDQITQIGSEIAKVGRASGSEFVQNLGLGLEEAGEGFSGLEERARQFSRSLELTSREASASAKTALEGLSIERLEQDFIAATQAVKGLSAEIEKSSSGAAQLKAKADGMKDSLAAAAAAASSVATSMIQGAGSLGAGFQSATDKARELDRLFRQLRIPTELRDEIRGTINDGQELEQGMSRVDQLLGSLQLSGNLSSQVRGLIADFLRLKNAANDAGSASNKATGGGGTIDGIGAVDEPFVITGSGPRAVDENGTILNRPPRATSPGSGGSGAGGDVNFGGFGVTVNSSQSAGSLRDRAKTLAPELAREFSRRAQRSFA